MDGGASSSAPGNPTGERETRLENELDRLKDLLLEHDRALSHKFSEGEKPSLAEKEARKRIVRRLNRIRRQLYRLKKGTEEQPTKRITFWVAERDYDRLEALAQDEGLSLSAYIRKQLFPDG